MATSRHAPELFLRPFGPPSTTKGQNMQILPIFTRRTRSQTMASVYFHGQGATYSRFATGKDQRLYPGLVVISPSEKTPVPACTAMILIRRLPFDIAPQIFTARCVYDERKKIFSIHKLKFDTGSQEFDVTLAESPSAPGKGPKVYKIKLTLVTEINPEVLHRGQGVA
ncbi:hypothetical protein K438DRAFT_1942484 [Mycena galopus ATCC 62051]|nr:hypothetical protein K438DRAFT_1942484 [Mycena galopus ATCC 62051]